MFHVIYAVLRTLLSVGCMLGGQFVAPFLMPFVNIFPGFAICLILCVCCAFICPVNILNSKNGNSRDIGYTMSTTCCIYYTTCVMLMCMAFRTVCTVQEYIPV
jgi:hypothetical protein